MAAATLPLPAVDLRAGHAKLPATGLQVNRPATHASAWDVCKQASLSSPRRTMIRSIIMLTTMSTVAKGNGGEHPATHPRIPTATQQSYMRHEQIMFVHFSICTFAGCEQDTGCRGNPPSLFDPAGTATSTWNRSRPFPAPTQPPLPVHRGDLVVHADWELIGACLEPDVVANLGLQVSTSASGSRRRSDSAPPRSASPPGTPAASRFGRPSTPGKHGGGGGGG